MRNIVRALPSSGTFSCLPTSPVAELDVDFLSTFSPWHPLLIHLLCTCSSAAKSGKKVDQGGRYLYHHLFQLASATGVVARAAVSWWSGRDRGTAQLAGSCPSPMILVLLRRSQVPVYRERCRPMVYLSCDLLARLLRPFSSSSFFLPFTVWLLVTVFHSGRILSSFFITCHHSPSHSFRNKSIPSQLSVLVSLSTQLTFNLAFCTFIHSA